ncbi:MAG: glycosyl transferase [Patescibacteria group bacterium]|nr:MAG: glycosyl transferase [Patescibacteria group bacterium]
MSDIFFSVIIPTLNEELFLPKLLDDLKKQKETNFEVIIVDGYSLDNTKKVALKYKKCLRLSFFESNKKNVASQRNFGASKAKGDYLLFLDADSRIKSTFLTKVKKFILKNKGLLFVPYVVPSKKDKIYKPLFDLANNLVEFSQKLPKKFSLGGSIIIERNFFHLMGGFNEELFMSEDHELIGRAFNYGVQTKFIKNSPVVFSLRRIKKEGEVKFFYKYFLATFRRLILNEEVTKKIFDYEMGGQVYTKSNLDKKTTSEYINSYFLKIKKLLRKFLFS